MMIDGRGCAIIIGGIVLAVFVAYAVATTVAGWL